MKAYSFANWNVNVYTRPFLFFIQSMEEMLFHYGHDSYKVPSLNFHFLCIEVFSCIHKIEIDILDKGNIRPLLEELNEMFLNDKIAQRLYGEDFQRLFFLKNDKGEYTRNNSSIIKEPTSEASMHVIQKTLYFLIEDMENNDKYFQKLKKEIEIIVNDKNFTMENSKRLYNLSKLFLTEVINRGYSQEYIYSQIKELYYSSKRRISDVSLEIEIFWNLFTFKNKEYEVFLPVKKTETKKLLQHFDTLKILDNKEGLFGNSSRWIVVVKIEALDPERARLRANFLMGFFVSLKQYNSHLSKSFYANQAIVRDIESQKEYLLKKPVTLLSRGQTRSEEQTYIKIGEIFNSFPIIGEKMITAINLHTSAMEDKNVSNQLLNLWTIIEVLVEVNKKYSYSKIVQICNILTTVLNASYIKSLVERLLLDLKHCCSDFDDYFLQVTKGNTEIEKMIALLVLPEFAKVKDNLINSLSKYPLIKYRIEDYSIQFSDRKNLKNFLTRHRKRLEWQIMRIYRNRNMIVHDGSHFPYIDLIVQNLHFYIDFLIDTINFYVGKGYESTEIIYALLSHNELKHLTLLEKVDNDKKPFPITDDFVEVVLGNSYIN